MEPRLEVLFTPAEFDRLPERNLSETVCVVFDVLRATSTMVTALANGAAAILPVVDIPQALGVRQREPRVLLAGERDGLLIGGELTGSIAFDLGNSPREFTREKVSGKTIAMTTTNGTRALRACAPARTVVLGSFLNLGAVAGFIQKTEPADLLLVCSGTFDQAAYEDLLAAGALCDLVWPEYKIVSDSALIARRLFRLEQQNILAAVARSRNGRRLLSRADLAEDVRFCAQRDLFKLNAEMASDGWVRSLGSN